MSGNRRRSLHDIAPPSEEEQPVPGEQNGNRETRLPSRSPTSQELFFQASSEFRHDTGTTAERVLDVAVGTTPGWSSSSSFYDILQPAALLAEPSYRHFPHLLVEASKATETDPQPKKEDAPIRSNNITEPISELPYVEPKHVEELPAPLKPSAESSFGTASWKSRLSYKGSSSESEDRSQGEISISGKDEYDREEPLITKTQKYYKKRPQLIPRYDDSDDSIHDPPERESGNLSPRNTGFHDLGDSESPGTPSEHIAERSLKGQKTPSSSEESLQLGKRGFGDRDLGSGMVFIYMVLPPDGGYGWLIMVLSFISQLIVDGIIFSIGSILPDIQREFGVSQNTIVLVASIQIGCYFFSGAFGSILINRFAFRPVSISGAISSILVIVAGSFSPNLGVLIVCYSAIGGATLSLMWVSSQLIVACYFERYRPIANGFSCSGLGIGAMAFSLANSVLVPIIGWRNILRVQAGLIVIVLLISIAFVEVKPTQVGVLPENFLDSSSDEYYGNFYVHYYLRSPVITSRRGSVITTYNPDSDKFKCCSCLRRCRRRRQERKDEARREEDHNLVIKPGYIDRDDLFYTGPVDYEKPHSKENIAGTEIHLTGTDQNTQQVNYGIQNMTKMETEEVAEAHRGSDKGTLINTTGAMERGISRKKPPPKRCADSKIMATLSRLFDYRLFKQFEFIILVAAAFLFPMGFNIPFVYSRIRTTIPSEYANLIAPAIGFSNFAVRNICGFMAYKRKAWTTVLCGGGLLFGGCFVFLSAFYGQNLVWFQMVYGLCYGVAPAVFSTLRALIYVKYLGIAKLTNAFGITALAMGSGVFIGTTIAGALVGGSQNYTAAFSFAGLCILTSGMLTLLLPSMVKCRDRIRNRKLEPLPDK